ncbi:hypothetical protein GS504_01405 [Rhodococcus hoagii]|nr:hypothetical protein [Prescottella equi]NKS71670.1 hypothetical protein [Prescottella equi]
MPNSPLVAVDSLALARFLVKYWVEDQAAPETGPAAGFTPDDIRSITDAAIDAGAITAIHNPGWLSILLGVDIDDDGHAAVWVSYAARWPIQVGHWEWWESWFGADARGRTDAVRNLIETVVNNANDVADRVTVLAREWREVFPAA